MAEDVESRPWLLLHAGALGDLVLSIQLAASIADVRRAGHLHVLSRTDSGDLSGLTPSVRRASLEGFSGQWLYVDTDAEPEQRLRARIAGRCVINALGDQDSRTHHQLAKLGPQQLYSFDPRENVGLATHITEQWRSDLARQGVQFASGDTPGRARSAGDGFLRGADDPVPPDRSLALAARTIAAAGGSSPNEPIEPCVLIHPGSGGADKCWPLPCFIDVARRLETSKVGVGFLLGPAEIERWERHDLAAIADEFRLVESPSPNELCTLLRDVSVFLGNDAGPTHLAALLGTSTVAVFGPTRASVWHPLGRSVQVFQGSPPASSTDWCVSPDRIAIVAADSVYEP